MVQPPQQKEHQGETAAPAARLALRRWGWALPVGLAFAGMLLGLATADHRLASRSAAVLLVASALIVVLEWVG